MFNRVLSKFREFHKLLRPAPADAERNIHFVLRVSDLETNYTMTYDSNADPFDESNCTQGGDALRCTRTPNRLGSATNVSYNRSENG